VQTLPVNKIIVVCGCIWAVAIIKKINKKKKLTRYGKNKQKKQTNKQTNYELVHFLKYEQ